MKREIQCKLSECWPMVLRMLPEYDVIPCENVALFLQIVGASVKMPLLLNTCTVKMGPNHCNIMLLTFGFMSWTFFLIIKLAISMLIY